MTGWISVNETSKHSAYLLRGIVMQILDWHTQNFYDVVYLMIFESNFRSYKEEGIQRSIVKLGNRYLDLDHEAFWLFFLELFIYVIW